MTWTLLAAVTAACIAVGSCALWLPDRTPTLLSSAGRGLWFPPAYRNTRVRNKLPWCPPFPVTVIFRQCEWPGHRGLVRQRPDLRQRCLSGERSHGSGVEHRNPLYRDLKTGDIGGDVLALNNELSLLGYNSVPGSDTYWRATSDGWKQLMADNGNTSDGSLSLADTLWIPEHEVAVDEWSATAGSMVTGGTAIGKIPDH